MLYCFPQLNRIFKCTRVWGGNLSACDVFYAWYTVKLICTFEKCIDLKGPSHPIFCVLLACMQRSGLETVSQLVFNLSVASLTLYGDFFCLLNISYQNSRRSLESRRWIYKFKKCVIGPYFSWRTVNKW